VNEIAIALSWFILFAALAIMMPSKLKR